jgi:hypothetical protein
MMRLGTKNRQLHQAEACKHYLRASHRDKLALVEEFIDECEAGDVTQWSTKFSDERRVEQEMLMRADAAFEKWVNGA